MRDWLKTNAASVGLLVFFFVLLGGLIGFSHWDENGRRSFGETVSESTICEGLEQLNTASQALSGVDVPQDSTSGCEPTDLPQMGSLVYYSVDMGTPTAFKNSVIGKGFNEGYGLQCVAGFKEFMFSLSGKYVAAAGGGAKGYATQQAQIEPLGFKWYSGTNGMVDGDWAIWTNGQYGHVAMKFGSQWLGQNQYASSPNTGNAFNLANISTSGIAGYYRPNIYKAVTPAPTPDPTPSPETGTGGSANNSAYTVRRGDTLGGIAIGQGWYIGTNGLYGDGGYAQKLAEYNGVQWRGLIYPNQVINQVK